MEHSEICLCLLNWQSGSTGCVTAHANTLAVFFTMTKYNSERLWWGCPTVSFIVHHHCYAAINFFFFFGPRWVSALLKRCISAQIWINVLVDWLSLQTSVFHMESWKRHPCCSSGQAPETTFARQLMKTKWTPTCFIVNSWYWIYQKRSGVVSIKTWPCLKASSEPQKISTAAKRTDDESSSFSVLWQNNWTEFVRKKSHL